MPFDYLLRMVTYLKKAPKIGAYGGGCGIRTHVTLLSNGFQDRLVMTASITLRVDYLIVLFLRFFLAFRILDRDHFGQVFYRLENGVF